MRTCIRNSFIYPLFILVVNAIASPYAGGAPTWLESLGGSNAKSLNRGCRTSDGCYVMVGEGPSDDDGYEQGWVVKTTAGGVVLWEKAVGSSPNVADFLDDVCQTADGGYLAVGKKITPGPGDDVYTAWAVKFNGSGDIQWQKTYAGALGREWFSSISPLSDGGALIAGETEPAGGGASDVWVVRIDASGTVLWARRYGGTDSDRISRILAARDGGFLLWGTSNSFTADVRYWLTHIDAGGNLDWSNRYEDALSGSPSARGIAQSAGGAIALTGHQVSITGNRGALAVILDESGTPIRPLYVDTSLSEYWEDIAALSDGGFVAVGGEHTNSGPVQDNGWAVRLDAAGSTSWWKQVIGSPRAEFRFVLANQDNGILLGGSSILGGTAGALLASLDSTGVTTGVGCAYITDSPNTLLPTTFTATAVVPTQTATGSIVKTSAGGASPTAATRTILCKGVGPDISLIKSKTSKPESTVTIRGAGFSPTASKNTVYFGTRIAKIQKAKSNNLRMTIPKRVKGTVMVRVVVDGLSSESVPFVVK